MCSVQYSKRHAPASVHYLVDSVARVRYSHTATWNQLSILTSFDSYTRITCTNIRNRNTPHQSEELTNRQRLGRRITPCSQPEPLRPVSEWTPCGWGPAMDSGLIREQEVGLTEVVA